MFDMWRGRLRGAGGQASSAGSSNSNIAGSTVVSAAHKRARISGFTSILTEDAIINVLRWCSAIALSRLMLVDKMFQALCVHQADVLLAEVCATATTRRRRAIAARTIQVLAHICDRAPLLDFLWADAVIEAVDMDPGNIGNIKIDLEALELLFLVFGDVSIEFDAFWNPDRRYAGKINDAAFFAVLRRLYDVYAWGEPSPFKVQGCQFHVTVGAVQQALSVLNEDPRTTCLRTRRRMRAYSEEDHSDADYVPTRRQAEEEEEEEEEEPIGVSIDGVWYPHMASYFDRPLNFHEVQEADGAFGGWDTELASSCGVDTCCHSRCNCVLADHVLRQCIDMEPPRDWRQPSLFTVLRRAPAPAQRDVMQRVQQLRYLPRSCACPRVQADQQREARWLAWRGRGRADPISALAREGKHVIVGVTPGPQCPFGDLWAFGGSAAVR